MSASQASNSGKQHRKHDGFMPFMFVSCINVTIIPVSSSLHSFVSLQWSRTLIGCRNLTLPIRHDSFAQSAFIVHIFYISLRAMAWSHSHRCAFTPGGRSVQPQPATVQPLTPSLTSSLRSRNLLSLISNTNFSTSTKPNSFYCNILYNFESSFWHFHSHYDDVQSEKWIALVGSTAPPPPTRFK